VLAQHLRHPVAPLPVVVEEDRHLAQPAIEGTSPAPRHVSEELLGLPGASQGEEEAGERDHRRDVVREQVEQHLAGDLRLDISQPDVDLLPVEGLRLCHGPLILTEFARMLPLLPPRC
jgi:hypothetical protein